MALLVALFNIIKCHQNFLLRLPILEAAQSENWIPLQPRPLPQFRVKSGNRAQFVQAIQRWRENQWTLHNTAIVLVSHKLATPKCFLFYFSPELFTVMLHSLCLLMGRVYWVGLVKALATSNVIASVWTLFTEMMTSRTLDCFIFRFHNLPGVEYIFFLICHFKQDYLKKIETYAMF